MRGRPIFYSAEEMAWLEANRSMIISDYHAAFIAKFDRADIGVLNLHGLRKRKGWFVGRKPGRFFGRRRKYSPEEMDWLRENATLPVADYCAAFCVRFQREDVFPANIAALRKRMGWKTGRTGQFEKGREPPNKGQKCPPGKGGNHPNARATQYRKGNRTGRANHVYKPIGAERLSKNGYLERKVHDGLPMQSRWKFVQTIRWEEINGPVPKGHALKCLDGDRLNTNPDNWIALPRSMLPRLNNRHGRDFDHAPAELKPLIMATAQIEQKMRDVGGKRKRKPLAK